MCAGGCLDKATAKLEAACSQGRPFPVCISQRLPCSGCTAPLSSRVAASVCTCCRWSCSRLSAVTATDSSGSSVALCRAEGGIRGGKQLRGGAVHSRVEVHVQVWCKVGLSRFVFQQTFEFGNPDLPSTAGQLVISSLGGPKKQVHGARTSICSHPSSSCIGFLSGSILARGCLAQAATGTSRARGYPGLALQGDPRSGVLLRSSAGPTTGLLSSKLTCTGRW